MNLKLVVFGALAVAGALLTLSLSSPQKKRVSEFDSFVKRHKKVYSSPSETEYRRSVFEQRLERIDRHNAKNSSYKLGINKFSDLTFEEFKRFYLSSTVLDNRGNHPAHPDPIEKGKQVDWREKNVITRVKDQQSCGSCWAFSSTGALEALFAITSGQDPVELSEQELVDCSTEQGNEGCNGGLQSYAYDYVLVNQLGTEEDYPYTAEDGDCNPDKDKTRFAMDSYTVIPKFDVSVLIKGINTQPLPVAIEVQDDFMDYTSGIYVNDNADCGDELNHGVLAVGYDTKDKTPFFIIKNSWGESWGETGYIRVAIGKGRGTCGIANKWDVVPKVSA